MIDKIYNHNKDEKPFGFGKLGDNALATLKNLNQVIEQINASGGLVNAGTALGGGKLVMMQGDSAVYFNPTDENNTGKILGFTLSSAVINTDVAIADSGQVYIGTTLIPGTVYYAGLNGTITATIPTTGIFQRVGVAVTDHQLKIEFSEPITTT